MQSPNSIHYWVLWNMRTLKHSQKHIHLSANELIENICLHDNNTFIMTEPKLISHAVWSPHSLSGVKHIKWLWTRFCLCPWEITVLWIRWGDGCPAEKRPPHHLPAAQVQGIEKDAGSLFRPRIGGGGIRNRKSPWAAQSQTVADRLEL